MARSISILRRRSNLIDLGVRLRDGVRSYDLQTATNFDGSFTDLASFPASGSRSVSVPESGLPGSQFRGWSRFLFAPSDFFTVVGTAVPGQTGVLASIDAVSGEFVTVGGLTGMTTDSVRRFLTLSGAATSGNNGTFRIVALVSATQVKILNTAGLTPDVNNGAITWTEKTATPMIDSTPFYLRLRQVGTDGVTGAYEAMHMVIPYSTVPNRPVVLKGTAPSGTTVADSLEIQLPGTCRNLFVQNNGSNSLFLATEPGGAEWEVKPIATFFTNLSVVFPNFTQLFVRGSGGTTSFNAMMELRTQPDLQSILNWIAM